MLANQQVSLQIQVFFLLNAYFAGKRKKFNEKWYELGKAEIFNAERNIGNAAKELDDQELLSKVGIYYFGFSPDLHAMEGQYRHWFKKEYFKIFCLECRQKQGGSKDKKTKKIACSDNVTITKDSCIEKKQPYTTGWFINRYKTVYIDDGGNEIKSQRFNV